ncbi:hypothetical protein [Burkholderia sola]|uniref:hypothetical protein n=1 Tax=Burkholderia sola TaxID=2843302 RepID=UPI00338E316A
MINFHRRIGFAGYCPNSRSETNRLTFPDDKTRTRRDHTKYLTLIRAIALLCQHQRETQADQPRPFPKIKTARGNQAGHRD